MRDPHFLPITTALVTPAALAISEYCAAQSITINYVTFTGTIADRIIRDGKATATSGATWIASRIIASRMQPGLRCRLELLHAGGDAGLQMLIDNAPGEIDWSDEKIDTKLSLKQREKLQAQLVGKWRVGEPYSGNPNRTIGLYGPNYAAFTVNLETTLKLEHHHQRREWIGADEDKSEEGDDDWMDKNVTSGPL